MANTKITSRVIADNSVGIDALNVTDGTNGQYLQTDGAGTLSFSTVSGYTDSDVETYLDGGTSTPTFSNTTISGNLSVDGGTIKLDGNYPTGTNNVVMGDTAFDSVTTASNNTIIGNAAGTAITTSNFNTAIGSGALTSQVSGGRNVAIGYGSLDADTTGGRSTAVGWGSLTSQNFTGNEITYNTAVGYNSTSTNTTGTNNTAVGYESLKANSTGAENTAVGSFALDANTTGSANVSVGYASLTTNTTGNYNTAVGNNALTNNTTASQNTAVGLNALQANTTGQTNTAVGHNALYANTTSNGNTAVGKGALVANTTGELNTAVGNGAGGTTTTGSRNTCLGQNARTAATNNDTIVIGYNVSQAGNGFVSMGSGGTTVYIPLTGSTTSWSATSDERLKKDVTNFNVGLDFINNLNTITFNWKKKGEVDSTLISVYEENSEEFVRGWDDSTHVGFLAQDIKEQVDAFNLPSGVKLWQEDSNGIQGVADGELIPMFVNAIKELSAKCDSLQNEINILKGD